MPEYTNYKGKYYPIHQGDPEFYNHNTRDAFDKRKKEIDTIINLKENLLKHIELDKEQYGNHNPIYDKAQESIAYYKKEIERTKMAFEIEMKRLELCLKQQEEKADRNNCPKTSKQTKQIKIEYQKAFETYCKNHTYKPADIYLEIPDDYIEYKLDYSLYDSTSYNQPYWRAEIERTRPNSIPITPALEPVSQPVSQPVNTPMTQSTDKPKKKAPKQIAERPPISYSNAITPPPSVIESVDEEESPEKKRWLELLKECNGDEEEAEMRQMKLAEQKKQEIPNPVIKKPIVKKAPKRETDYSGTIHTYGIPE